MSDAPPDEEGFYRDTGDTIDQEGLWGLVRVDDYAEWESWIIHGCERYDEEGCFGHVKGVYISCDMIPPECDLCKEPPPERIITLWLLHNWDANQKYGRGRV